MALGARYSSLVNASRTSGTTSSSATGTTRLVRFEPDTSADEVHELPHEPNGASREKALAARARVPLPRALLGMAVHQLYHSRNVAAIVL